MLASAVAGPPWFPIGPQNPWDPAPWDMPRIHPDISPWRPHPDLHRYPTPVPFFDFLKEEELRKLKERLLELEAENERLRKCRHDEILRIAAGIVSSLRAQWSRS